MGNWLQKALSILFFVLAFSSGLKNAYANSNSEAERLRKFLFLVISSGNSEQSLQPQFLRHTLAQYADLLPILVDKEKTQRLLQDADLASSLSMVTKEATLHDALAKSIEGNLASIAERIIGIDFDPYLSFVSADLKAELLEKSKIKDRIQFLAERIAQMDKTERMKYLSLVPGDIFLTFNQHMDNFVEKVKFSQTPSLSLITQETSQIQVSGLTPEDIDFLSQSFLKYFDDLPAYSKRKILAAWVNLPPGASQEKQLAEVLQNSGPVLQKMFQLLGRDTKSPRVRAIMQELLSNVKPFPTEDAKKIIEKDLGKPLNEIFSYFSDKPLAAGTVGQVHKAKLKNGKEVVVKVLRPGLREQMKDEFEVFKLLTQDNTAAHEMVTRLELNFTAELDLLHEAENFAKAERYINPRLGITIPKLVDDPGPTQNVLLMDLAKGRPLSDFADLDPRIKGLALYNTMKRWFEEVMFDSGFFHGDMHPGNLMLELTPGEKLPYRLTILDIGSAGTISLEQRRQFLRFFASVMSGEPEEILNGIRGFGEVPTNLEAELIQVIQNIVKNEASHFEQANEIMGEALRRGLKLDPMIVMFNRANLFLYRELQKTNLEIMAKYPKAKLYKPVNAYMMVSLKRAGIEIPKNLLSHTAAQESVLETQTLKKFFLAQTKQLWRTKKSQCHDFFTRLLQRPLALEGPKVPPRLLAESAF